MKRAFITLIIGANILTYTFTNDGNCSSGDSLTVFVENCLGLEMPDQNNWSVHLNPFTNTLTITFGTIPGSDYVAEMYSVIGERIDIQRLSAAQSQLIQLPELNAGVLSMSCGSWIRKQVAAFKEGHQGIVQAPSHLRQSG